jgi:hypothetical protein
MASDFEILSPVKKNRGTHSPVLKFTIDLVAFLRNSFSGFKKPENASPVYE